MYLIYCELFRKSALNKIQKLSFLPSVMHGLYRCIPTGKIFTALSLLLHKESVQAFQLPVVAHGFMESDLKMPPLLCSPSAAAGSCG